MKFRKSANHFITHKPDGGMSFTQKFTIMVLSDGHWRLLGDESGILKFATELERDNYLTNLKKEVAASPSIPSFPSVQKS